MRSMTPENATANGIFHETGYWSRPVQGQKPVRLVQVTDGASSTILFGERYHRDGNWNSWLSAPFQPPPVPGMMAIESYGVWAPVGTYAIADVTLSGYATVNFGTPIAYIPPPPPPPPMVPPPPPPVPWSDFQPNFDLRLCAFGSGHDHGANFCLCDGSVHFVSESISLTALQALCTRAGGEVVQVDQ